MRPNQNDNYQSEVYAKRYSFGYDVWAVGVVLFGLIDGSFPFRDQEEVETKEVELENLRPQVTMEPSLRSAAKVWPLPCTASTERSWPSSTPETPLEEPATSPP